MAKSSQKILGKWSLGKKENSLNMICSTSFVLRGTRTSGRKPSRLGLPRCLECEVRNPTKKEAKEEKPPNPCPILELSMYGGDIYVH